MAALELTGLDGKVAVVTGAGRMRSIGQLLRHQSIDTTAEYAKVDRIALSRLALPWPGSES